MLQAPHARICTYDGVSWLYPQGRTFLLEHESSHPHATPFPKRLAVFQLYTPPKHILCLLYLPAFFIRPCQCKPCLGIIPPCAKLGQRRQEAVRPVSRRKSVQIFRVWCNTSRALGCRSLPSRRTLRRLCRNNLTVNVEQDVG